MTSSRSEVCGFVALPGSCGWVRLRIRDEGIDLCRCCLAIVVGFIVFKLYLKLLLQKQKSRRDSDRR